MHITSSPFPLRKTLLALTIGAITQSAVAADNTADSNKNEEVMLVRRPKAAILSRRRPGGTGLP